jgi:hypothetical protein
MITFKSWANVGKTKNKNVWGKLTIIFVVYEKYIVIPIAPS